MYEATETTRYRGFEIERAPGLKMHTAFNPYVVRHPKSGKRIIRFATEDEAHRWIDGLVEAVLVDQFRAKDVQRVVDELVLAAWADQGVAP